ncbi:hypothetical protein FRB90_011661 [Tulasnella sp. 427]|nr:hypothetical protein FRB90_011661 [Tulasnella sp. 427]
MRAAVPLSALLYAGVSSAALFQYTLNLTTGTAALDGVTRNVYLVNGQTPGPDIVVDQGDDVSITIVNDLPVEATMHFHGIEQKGSMWSDGVPGITQRMIDPGNSFVANFTATNSGQSWYHAHSKAIYGDGIKGNFYVRASQDELNNGPWSQISTNSADIAAMKAAHQDPKIIAISDWTHWDSEWGIAEWNRTKTELICVDSVLINGKGRVICPPPETFTPYLNDIVPAVTPKGCAYPNNSFVQPFDDKMPDEVDPSVFWECTNTTSPLSVVAVNASDKWASVGFNNQGVLWDFRVSIDNHTFWVYAADGQFHDVQEVDVINVPPGERITAMIKLDGDGDYAIRASASITPQFISGYGVLSYSPSSTSSQNIPEPRNQKLGYGGDTRSGFKELDPMTLKAFPSTLVPPQTANKTIFLELYRLNSMEWSMNSNPFAPFLELVEPLMFSPSNAQQLNQSLVPSYPVGTVVDAVIQLNPGNPKHPLHKHGRKAWIIGQGPGIFNWTDVASAIKDHPEYFNLDRPPYRDGFHTPDSVPSANWMVIRYIAEEQSVTFFHCHINIHTVGGMAVALMEGMDAAPTDIPQYYIQWDQAAAQAQAAKKVKRDVERNVAVGAGSLMPAVVKRARNPVAWREALHR